MRRHSTPLLNLAIVLSLAFSGIVSGVLNPTLVASGTANTQVIASGEVTPEPAARKMKRERKHDRKQKNRNQDRKQKDRKSDRKKNDRKSDRKKDRNQKNSKQNRQHPVELTSGRLPAAVAVGGADAGQLSAEERYIVVLEDGAGDALSAATDMAAATDGVIPTHVYRYVFPGFAAVIPDDKLNDIRNDPRVKAVVADRVVHAYDDQTLPTGVDRIDANLNPTANIDGIDERVDVDVAVIDTAGDDVHPDLNIWAWANCTSSPNDSDDDGHGTHVGGTIGALDNDTGVVGVAPGARLWNLRVLVNGGGYDSWIICGLDLVTKYATDQGDGFGDIEVANLSLGGGGSDSSCQFDPDDDFHQAFCRAVAAGVTVVVAAGNSSDDAANHTPAAYDEVITVSALADSNGQPGGGGPNTSWGRDDTLAGFSNFGADIDIAAPGVDILSTVPGGYDGDFSGTSMASPHVAGAAALYLTSHPGATPAQVKSALLSAREMIHLPNDFDGIDEGVLYVGDDGSSPPPPAPPLPPPPPRQLPAPPPPTDDFTWPEVEWVAPVGNNQEYTASAGTVEMMANASDDVKVEYVEFWRYDEVAGWVWISTDETKPYQSSINVGALSLGFNELTADAYDAAGNWNYESIFVNRVNKPPPLPPTPPLPTVDPPPVADGGMIAPPSNNTKDKKKDTKKDNKKKGKPKSKKKKR